MTIADTTEIKLPRPHPAQREFLTFPGSTVVLAGRRFGKTQAAVYRILQSATTEAGLYWWVGLTWRSASLKRAWRLLKFYSRKVWQAAGQPPRIREADKEIYLPNGSAILMRSAERPDSLAGEGLRGVVLDEFTLMAETVWTEYIEAALLDYGGWALFIGVPKGENWGARLFRRAFDRKDWIAQRYTTYDNPFIPRGRIDEIRDNVTEAVFQQEYLAEITADAGAVFRGVREVSTALPLQEAEPGGCYVMAVDWGREIDYTVISVFDANTKRQVYLDRFGKIGWSLQRGRIHAVHEMFKPDIIWAEENSIGSVNIEALQNEGLPVQPFMTTAQSKKPLIEGLALAIERGEITLLDNDVQIGELQAYTMERMPSGNFRYNAPSGMHDDCVIATALAWHGINTRAGRPFSIDW